MPGHSSPSFGSHPACSTSPLGGRRRLPQGHSRSSLSLRLGDYSPFDSHVRCTPWSVFQDGRLMIAGPARRKALSIGSGLNSSGSYNTSGKPLAEFNPEHVSQFQSTQAAPGAALKHATKRLALNSPYPSSTFTAVSTHSTWLLFTFPSRYLFAIGHVIIFSFRRVPPPNWRSITKLRDSTNVRSLAQIQAQSDTGL